MSSVDQPRVTGSAERQSLVSRVAGRAVALAVGGDAEVARVVFAAYRVESAGGQWDPEAGRTALDRTTVERAAKLGQLLTRSGMADYEHGISPGPVVNFTGASLLLDLRFGDPDEDARAVEAITRGFEELDLTLGEGAAGGVVISGGS